MKKFFEAPEIDVIEFNMSESIADIDIGELPSQPDWDIDIGGEWM